MKISDNIHIIKHNLQNNGGANCLNPDFVYSLILFGDRITLINTGPVGSESSIFEYIRKQGRQVGEIDTLILTHAKMEFIGAAPAIKFTTNCTIVAHFEESKRIESLIIQNAYCNKTTDNLKVKVNYPVEGNEKFTFGDNLDVDLIYTSNNTGGFLSVYFSNYKVLFSENPSAIPFSESGYAKKSNSNLRNNKLSSVKEVETLITPFDEPVSGIYIKLVA
jgi:glyoxylase-like metal-dependent hydrolase (beta-lactamase superfamily II)